MSLPPHQIKNQWKFQFQKEVGSIEQERANPNFEHTSTRTLQPHYPPFVTFPAVANGMPLVHPDGALPYGGFQENCSYPPYSFHLHRNTTHRHSQHPQMSMSHIHTPPTTSSAPKMSGEPDIPTTAVTESEFMSVPNASMASPSFGISVSLASASLPAMMSVAYGPPVRRQYKHRCLECGNTFDRARRARDCANKNLGLTPFACRGRCGKLNCNKAYSSEVLLNEHVAPLNERVTQCVQCERIISKKNFARHKREACVGVAL